MSRAGTERPPVPVTRSRRVVVGAPLGRNRSGTPRRPGIHAGGVLGFVHIPRHLAVVAHQRGVPAHQHRAGVEHTVQVFIFVIDGMGGVMDRSLPAETLDEKYGIGLFGR